MRLLSVILPALLAAVAGCGSAPADLVVYGRVWTGDSARPWAGGVAIAGDTIVAVDDSVRIARLVGRGTEVIDNAGGLVAPGFQDGHTHFLSGGFQLASVDLRDAATPAEFIARIKAYAATLAPGEWILGGDWDHQRWVGTPLPRRQWIDSVTPDNPVFVSRLDGHMALANSLALGLAGVNRHTPARAGGVIVRTADGDPTGILKDNAMDPVFAMVPDPSPAQRDSALARALRYAAERGLTGIAEMNGGPAARAAYQRAEANGTLTLRVALYHPLADWRSLAGEVMTHGWGDKWIRVGGLKGFVDGSLGSGTAAFIQPYSDAPGQYGTLVTPESDLRQWIGSADSAGLQLAIHAIGDRANQLLLDIFDSVAAVRGQRDRRWRIEHAQHLRPADIPRLAELGVIASMQPYHAIDDGRWAETKIGSRRSQTTYAFRSLLDQGVRLVFGSDWTVAPLDPLLGIDAAVNRRTLDGKHPEGWVPSQRIRPEEALAAYTSAGAYGVFAELERGRLRAGYLADLVLLDRDLTAISPDSITAVRVRATIVGGRVVYRASR